jgi:Zn-finger nucleic acid-binding protein
VLREHLVLVCPACQVSADWTADLDNCARCGGVHMIRRLDQVECLDCGQVRDAAGVQLPDAVRVPDAAFADEVSRALERVLGQHPLFRGLLCLFCRL